MVRPDALGARVSLRRPHRRKRQGGNYARCSRRRTKNASDKKTFVWTLDEWRAKCGKVLASKDRYFLITKDPITMKSILVDDGL